MNNIEAILISYLTEKLGIDVRAEIANEQEEINLPYIVIDLTGGREINKTGFVECNVAVQVIDKDKLSTSNLANEVYEILEHTANEVPEIMKVECNLPYNWSIQTMYRYQIVTNIVYRFK